MTVQVAFCVSQCNYRVFVDSMDLAVSGDNLHPEKEVTQTHSLVSPSTHLHLLGFMSRLSCCDRSIPMKHLQQRKFNERACEASREDKRISYGIWQLVDMTELHSPH
ncbi:unnamed protein product [Schistosoma mattheei]|uniref:Uncharacterized protein n=1 Tax=Schistosoma mattheei TaxID=31246 RepID=A0A183PXZ6_9TREM|nr:unnamed protein product [Schistosoma mattheei]